MSPRILITGASGLLGRAVFELFSTDPQWQTQGLAFERANDKLKKVDITNPEEVKKVIFDFKPAVIIHAAANRWPDKVEKNWDETLSLNVNATRNICEQAEKMGAFVIYISTDFVFDGKKPPFKHDSKTNPLNKYGDSKLRGEKATLEVNEDNIVLRVPILYGKAENFSESAVLTLYNCLLQTDEKVQVDDYRRSYPTNTEDIAYVLKAIAEHKLMDPSLSGIFHWSGDECYTKYGMMKVMADLYKLPIDHIEPVKTANSASAARPFDAHLDNSRLLEIGVGSNTPFQMAVKICIDYLLSKSK